MAKLILIRGAMGSGKSTYAQKLKDGMIKYGYNPNNIVICENDQYFTDKDGNYKYDVTKRNTATRVCLEKAIATLEKGGVAIVANTFGSIDEMQPYLDYVKANDIPLSVYRCNGEYQNQHNVPEEVVIAKRKSMQPYDGEIVVK